MNKRGQFFLIAAVVIVVIIIALAKVNISTKAPKGDSTIYDLSKEIDYESNQLIDSGIYRESAPGQINQSILSLVANYSAANPDTDIMVVYGNGNKLTALLFTTKSEGEFIGISTGGATSGLKLFTKTIVPLETNILSSGGAVEILLNNTLLANFTLKEGENFYLILQKNTEEERLVAY